MLKKLDVSRLGFYDYLKRVPSKTELRKERITKEIKKIHKESYEIYGSPKITELLNKKGEKVSQKYVYSIMKENNIKAKYIKPYIQTTVSHDFSDKLKNLLNRHYNPTKPNVAWCTDITYIWIQDGFVYLNCVMDFMPGKSLPGHLQILWKYLQLLKLSTKLKLVVILTSHLLFILIVAVNMCQLRGVKPLKQCREVILTAVILMVTLASNRSTP